MIEQPDNTQAAGLEALDILRLMIQDNETSPAARVSAAKALLDRYTPKEDAERERREAEERANAIAEARYLLGTFAVAAAARFHEPPALVADGTAGTDNATDDDRK